MKSKIPIPSNAELYIQIVVATAAIVLLQEVIPELLDNFKLSEIPEPKEEEVPLPPVSSKERSPVVDSYWKDVNEADALVIFVVVNGIIRIALK